MSQLVHREYDPVYVHCSVMYDFCVFYLLRGVRLFYEKEIYDAQLEQAGVTLVYASRDEPLPP